MTNAELQDLLHLVRHGNLDPSSAASKILAAMRAAPFEDLGFARVDTHRARAAGISRSQSSASARRQHRSRPSPARIVERGQTLLVTRAQTDVYDAVRARGAGR